MNDQTTSMSSLHFYQGLVLKYIYNRQNNKKSEEKREKKHKYMYSEDHQAQSDKQHAHSQAPIKYIMHTFTDIDYHIHLAVKWVNISKNI